MVLVIFLISLVWSPQSYQVSGAAAPIPPLPGERENQVHGAALQNWLVSQEGQTFLQSKGDDQPPKTIRVRVTGSQQCDLTRPYTVQTIDFYEYVRHVLPNEWIYTWDPESLRAGAMAVKMYAWYWVEHGGKWSDADVYDSVCDQAYDPLRTNSSTDQAIRTTWNWKLTLNGELFQTRFMRSCHPPYCMSQLETFQLARSGYTWDEILSAFYPGSQLAPISPPKDGYALWFPPNYSNQIATGIQIPLVTNELSSGANIGDTNFTIEMWLKTGPQAGQHSPTLCSSKIDWKQGQALLDRSQGEVGAQYGVSLMAGRLVFGVTNSKGLTKTLCGQTPFGDNHWHHVAVQRSLQDGGMWIFIDGKLDAFAFGLPGDVSYHYQASAGPSNHILGLGAWKDSSSASQLPYQGWLDELRFSDVLRYTPAGFVIPTDFYEPDAFTTALYHFNEGLGRSVVEVLNPDQSSGAAFRVDPASPASPQWVAMGVFSPPHNVYLPYIHGSSSNQ